METSKSNANSNKADIEDRYSLSKSALTANGADCFFCCEFRSGERFRVDAFCSAIFHCVN